MTKYFANSFLGAAVGLALAALVGWRNETTLASIGSALFLTLVLAILEISLSFDNAVVNASVLRRMTPLWRRRFLTWGIVVAVFGMRLILPLVLVSAMAVISPLEALRLALRFPDRYAALMQAIHVPVAAFGGTFLLMVALDYFLNHEKEVHWVRFIEEPLRRLGRIQSLESVIALTLLMGLSKLVPVEQSYAFLAAGVCGLILFLLVGGIAAIIEHSGLNAEGKDLHKASVALFIYLEILDASFSFDGVIGAFAVSRDLFLIVIGLGIGALFVRSLTIYLVEVNALEQFRFLEHGAFYAIFALALFMCAGAIVPIPEVVTGLTGALLIGVSLWSSIRANRKDDAFKSPPAPPH